MKEIEIVKEEKSVGTHQDSLIEKAKLLAASDLLPPAFQKKPANVLIALELAKELSLSPLMVMQNVHIIHGKPSFSSAFLLALLHKSGDFSKIDFEVSNEGDKCRLVAYPTKGSEKPVEGPWVSLEMAKAEGWSTKAGSKWKTMPELMLRYRAATFFVRTCAPHLLMGFQTHDEVEDIRANQSKVTRSASELLKRNPDDE